MAKNITWTSQVYVGIDQHADSLVVAAVGRDCGSEALEQWKQGNDERSWKQLVKKLRAYKQPVRCVYEAGPCGYKLQRFLTAQGMLCEVTAPSLIPRRAGDRVKTNGRDAVKLARLYRAGELTMVRIPDEQQEQLRDVMRGREACGQDVLRCRQRLSKFLLRRGHRYNQGQHWTQRHWQWMRSIGFELYYEQCVFQMYVRALEEKTEQLRAWDQLVLELGAEPRHQAAAQPLMVLRGVDLLTALTIVAEAGDLRAYKGAPSFMASIGLVPSEDSSGETQRRGGITKTGNAHLRRVLVEAAWHYYRPFGRSTKLKRRRQGQPAHLLAIAKKADQRISTKFRKLILRRMAPRKAATAAARELAGFVWALGQPVQQEA